MDILMTMNRKKQSYKHQEPEGQPTFGFLYCREVFREQGVPNL